MHLTVTQTKDFRCRQRCAFLVRLSFLAGFVQWPSSPPHLPTGKPSHLVCGAESLQVRPEQGGGQDKGTGDKGMSLYGQTLDWRGRGQLRGAKHVYGLLSVGTQEQPDPGHLVDDFQRTHQDKHCVCVCVCVRVMVWCVKINSCVLCVNVERGHI